MKTGDDSLQVAADLIPAAVNMMMPRILAGFEWSLWGKDHVEYILGRPADEIDRRCFVAERTGVLYIQVWQACFWQTWQRAMDSTRIRQIAWQF